jgi:hypothetical protein
MDKSIVNKTHDASEKYISAFITIIIFKTNDIWIIHFV